MQIIDANIALKVYINQRRWIVTNLESFVWLTYKCSALISLLANILLNLSNFDILVIFIFYNVGNIKFNVTCLNIIIDVVHWCHKVYVFVFHLWTQKFNPLFTPRLTWFLIKLKFFNGTFWMFPLPMNVPTSAFFFSTNRAYLGHGPWHLFN